MGKQVKWFHCILDREIQDRSKLSILSQSMFYNRMKLMHLLPAQPCLLCGVSSHDGICCAACKADLPSLPAAACPICALPTPTGGVCGACLRQEPPFDHAFAAFSYDFPLDKLVQALKFHEHLVLVNLLADALIKRVNSSPDRLIALPLHPVRLRERGFNQSLLLARRISKRLDIPLLAHVCERVRNTPPQSALPWKERGKNMRQAFICKSEADVRDKHIAIVDDVMTTGASIGELARILKQAGAREVSALVVARTLPRDH
jgi:ComF family protein